jgi:hypothetical protein
MTTLAWKNLFHDKVRLGVTLTGIVFALVLILVQFGLFLGFLDTSANVVEHSRMSTEVRRFPRSAGTRPSRYRK